MPTQRHIRDARAVLGLPDDVVPVMGVHMRRQDDGTLVCTQGPNNTGMNSRPQHAARNTHRRVNSPITRVPKYHR
jgi:L-2-hydroxyglutarate oxidase LhgO